MIFAIFLLPLEVFAVVTFGVCILGVWEWGNLMGFSSIIQRIWLVILCCLLIISLIVVSFTMTYRTFISICQTTYVLWAAIVWWMTALILVLTYPYSAVFWRDSVIIRLAFCVLTILPFFCGMISLRQQHYDSNKFTGSWWLLYVMVLVWSTDSGCYLFGRVLGKKKLAPTISPGKTWEGLVGGLLTSFFIALLFYRYAPFDTASTSTRTFIIGSTVSVLASVLGDLTESMFKRASGIKHSSNLIPGHGGLLDRIDSLTSAVPVFTFLMLLIFNAI